MHSVWQKLTRLIANIKTASFIAALTASLILPTLADPTIAHAGGINNTRGDAWGTLEVSGTDSNNLGGAGVNIYSNGSTTDYRDCSGNIVLTYSAACKDSVNSVVAGAEWQCVEFVNRLYLTKGWTTATWTGDGGQLYDNAPASLAKELNGSITSLSPGDTLVLQDSGAGHAAIIDTYNSGTGAIKIESQDTNVVYDTTFSLSSGTISSTGWGTYSVKGVIHHPTGSATPSLRPAALAADSSNMDVFYPNGSNLMARYWNVNTGWALTSWPISPASAATAIARTGNTMNVFFRDANNNLIDQHWGPSG